MSDSLQPYGLQRARQTSLSFTVSWSLLTFRSTESMMLSNHLILCRPLLLLPSVFPSIRVFSSESALHIILWHCWPSRFSFFLCPHVLISTSAAWMKSHSFLTLLTAPLFPSWGQKKKIIWFQSLYGNLFCGQRLVYLEMFSVHLRRL